VLFDPAAYRSHDANTATRVRPIAPNIPLARNVTEALLGFLEAVPFVAAAELASAVAVAFDDKLLLASTTRL